jgi:hypothetical protein
VPSDGRETVSAHENTAQFLDLPGVTGSRLFIRALLPTPFTSCRRGRGWARGGVAARPRPQAALGRAALTLRSAALQPEADPPPAGAAAVWPSGALKEEKLRFFYSGAGQKTVRR